MPDYEVDGAFFLKQNYEGGFIYRQLILVEAKPDKNALGGWTIKMDISKTAQASPISPPPPPRCQTSRV